MSMLIKDIVFGYGSKDVLNGVSFKVSDGEITSIIGPNGSGKSTLVKCIDGILKAKSGEVYIDSKKTKDMTLKEMAKIIAYVPQVSNEVFFERVFDTVLMGRRPHLNWGVRKVDLEIVAEVLEYMELTELSECYLNELSGGQKQKVIIARALAQEPDILLLDEPTSSLDIKHQLEVLEIVKKISSQRKSSVIMVIHDLNMAYRFSDNLVLLKEGNIFASGTPDSVLTKENINRVYEVEVTMANTDVGPCILPIRSSEHNHNSFNNEAIV